MKAIIDDVEYTAISNIKFSPETDITGDRTPINELSIDIKTTDSINVGSAVWLYDNTGVLWAKYWIIYAEREDVATVRVNAQSGLKLLERDMKDPVMYEDEPVTNIFADIFESMGAESYSVESTLSGATVSGFCPNQSAKTRLQWVCFSIGAYVRSSFSDRIEIRSILTENEKLIPLSKTFWKPKITYNDYVTALVIIAYSFTKTTPTSTDEWVTDGTDYWVVSHQRFTLRNPDVPASALEHVVTFEDVLLVNEDNVSALLSFFSTHYFKRMVVDLDVINNAEYLPGDRCIFYTGRESLAIGYVDTADFTFGTQARSRLSMTPVEQKDGALLIVKCIYEGGGPFPQMQIDTKTYFLPVGYEYDIENLYVDTLIGGHRVIFRPKTNSVSGTMESSGVVVAVLYEMALDLYKKSLHVVSVDDAEFEDGELSMS